MGLEAAGTRTDLMARPRFGQGSDQRYATSREHIGEGKRRIEREVTEGAGSEEGRRPRIHTACSEFSAVEVAEHVGAEIE